MALTKKYIFLDPSINSLLKLELLHVSDPILSHITLYTPANNHPNSESYQKYSKMCDALSLSRKPTLVIIEDIPFGKISGNITQAAYYSLLSNSIFMKRSLFENFSKGDKNKEFEVAHELGYAKSAYSRRGFIVGAAATGVSVVTGASVGGLTKLATDAIGVSKDDSWDKGDAIPGFVGALAAVKASHIIYEFLTDRREFSADAKAAGAMAGDDYFKILAEEAKAEVKKNIGENEYKQQRRYFEENLRRQPDYKRLSPAELDTAFIIAFARLNEKEFKQARQASGMIAPSDVERLAKFSTQREK